MAQKFDEIKHSLNDSLHDDTKPWKSPLDLVEQKTGVPRVYIVIGENHLGNINSLSHCIIHVCDDANTFWLMDFFISAT